MISHLNGGNLAMPPTGHDEPDWTGVGWNGRTYEQDEERRIVRMLRRGAFVAYCGGYGCGTALYLGGEYVHCALGSYCRRCWNEIQTDMRLEREWGHDHGQS